MPVHETKDLVSVYFQLQKKMAMFAKKLKNIGAPLKRSLIKIESITSFNSSEKIHLEKQEAMNLWQTRWNNTKIGYRIYKFI